MQRETHPKILEMMHKLRLDHPITCIGIIGQIRLLALEYASDGGVGRYANHEIAEYLEWPGDTDELIQALVEVGFLLPDPLNRLRINREWEHVHPNMSEIWLSIFRSEQQDSTMNRPCN